MSVQNSVPNLNVPLVDVKTGIITRAWALFFSNLVVPSQPIVSITVGASPFSYIAPSNGHVLVQGGTVSALELVRARVTIALTQTIGFVPVSQGDVVTVTHTGAPAMWFIPA